GSAGSLRPIERGRPRGPPEIMAATSSQHPGPYISAILVAGGRPPGAPAPGKIARVAPHPGALGRSSLADPPRVLQVHDTALVVAGHAINVGRRGTDGFWRPSSPTKQCWKRSVTPGQNSSSELHPTGSVRGPKSGLGVAGALH